MSLFYTLLGVAIGAAVFIILCVCCLGICGRDINRTSMLVIRFLTCGCCGRGRTRIHPQHHETYEHMPSAVRPLVVVNTAKDSAVAQQQHNQILKVLEELKRRIMRPVADAEPESDTDDTDSDTDKSDSEPSEKGFLTLPSLSSLKLK